MIASEIHLVEETRDGLNRLVRIGIRSDAGGVDQFDVRNRADMSEFELTVSGCPPVFVFTIWISATHFPISVRASECINGVGSGNPQPVPTEDPDGINRPPA